ncbi:MAG TPA: S-layer protein domain-containing protein [Methanotrichaceae archaeon]|nr:S-layer protein domain-containing protein [Methanotrichaceae archaeon]
MDSLPSGWGKVWTVDRGDEKYFVAYAEDSLLSSRPQAQVSSPRDQISKVLVNDNYKGTFTEGTPWALEEGYVLSIKSIDARGDNVTLELAKDGKVVDCQTIDAGIGTDDNNRTYRYVKNLDKMGNTTIIAMHFLKALKSGDRAIAAIDSVWQISDMPTDNDADILVPEMNDFMIRGLGGFLTLDIQDKEYFAGYVEGGYLYRASRDPYLLSWNQARSILINYPDANISVGQDVTNNSIKLNEGYELVVKAIDAEGNKVYVELQKGGNVVDSDLVYAGVGSVEDCTYLYRMWGGANPELAIIAVHFKDISRNAGQSTAAVDWVWQISENSTELSS